MFVFVLLLACEQALLTDIPHMKSFLALGYFTA